MCKCVHDTDRRYEVLTNGVNLKYGTLHTDHITSVYCSKCDELLYARTLDTITMESRTVIYDEMYELLYTKRGRKELVIESLKRRGIDIPMHWTNKET